MYLLKNVMKFKDYPIKGTVPLATGTGATDGRAI